MTHLGPLVAALEAADEKLGTGFEEVPERRIIRVALAALRRDLEAISPPEDSAPAGPASRRGGSAG